MKEQNYVNKNAKHKIDVVANIWPGKWFLFQTFEELDGVKDKQSETLQIRQLLDNDQEEKTAC